MTSGILENLPVIVKTSTVPCFYSVVLLFAGVRSRSELGQVDREIGKDLDCGISHVRYGARQAGEDISVGCRDPSQSGRVRCELLRRQPAQRLPAHTDLQYLVRCLFRLYPHAYSL